MSRFLSRRRCISLESLFKASTCFVEGLKYPVGEYKNLPSSVGATSWSPGSCRLCPVIWEPIVCLSGRRSVLTHLQACLGVLSLQRSVRYPWFYCRCGISLCQTYWQTGPLVVNLIGLASWLGGRFCVCSSDRAEARVVVISDQGEPVILPIICIRNETLSFVREILWFHCSMGWCR